MINPPALGSYVAERRANDLDAAALQGGGFDALPEGEVAELPVSSFVARAAAGGESLAGRDVSLTGFVSRDDTGSWYVTRMSMACCAADAAAFRVRVEAADAPPDEQWVEVTGTWVEGTTDPVDPRLGPAIAADDVALVDEPRNPYE